jgi:hypothetical protein
LKKRAVRWVLYLLFLLAIGEVGARLALLALGDSFTAEFRTRRAIYQEQTAGIQKLLMRPGGLVQLDTVLGWRYRAGFRDSSTMINIQGLRGTRDYSSHPVDTVFRVAAFGDSFVYSNEVNTQDSWASLLENRYPDIEILNYGVGGYGVDQAYLRYLHEGKDLSPDLILIGFIRDDITRVVNVYRRFRSTQEVPLTKPRFGLDRSERLVHLASPLRVSDYEKLLEEPSRVAALGKYDYWYDSAIYRNPLYDYSALVRIVTGIGIRVANRLGSGRLIRDGVLNSQSEAFRVQLALFRNFVDSARARGARPVILLFPDREDILGPAERPSALDPLRRSLQDHQLEYLDLREAFRAQNHVRRENLFMPGGHYSPEGNLIVAEWLGSQLKKMKGRAPPA